MYGITETTVHVTYRPLVAADLGRPWPASIGVPIPDLQAYVLDRDLQPRARGRPGRAVRRRRRPGPRLPDRPELDGGALRARPVCRGSPARGSTARGDRWRWLADGSLEYLGRLDPGQGARLPHRAGRDRGCAGQHPTVGRPRWWSGKGLPATPVWRPTWFPGAKPPSDALALVESGEGSVDTSLRGVSKNCPMAWSSSTRTRPKPPSCTGRSLQSSSTSNTASPFLTGPVSSTLSACWPVHPVRDSRLQRRTRVRLRADPACFRDAASEHGRCTAATCSCSPVAWARKPAPPTSVTTRTPRFCLGRYPDVAAAQDRGGLPDHPAAGRARRGRAIPGIARGTAGGAVDNRGASPARCGRSPR